MLTKAKAEKPMHNYPSYAMLAASMALVGSYVAISKPLVAVFSVFLLAWLRFAIATLALAPWYKKPHSEAPLNRTTHFYLFLESFFGNFLFSLCMLYGVSMTSAVSAGIIMATLPACVALLSWAMLKESIAPRTWFAIACAVMGMVLLTVAHDGKPSAPRPTLDGSAFLGNFLVFGAVWCEAAYAVIGKRLTRDLSAKRITALINLWGLVLVTPPGIWAAWSFDWTSPSWGLWALLMFYALAASMGSVWLWMTGLKRVPASQAGVFTAMLPISAALVGVLFLGERLNTMQAVAFTLVVLGITATARQK